MPLFPIKFSCKQVWWFLCWYFVTILVSFEKRIKNTGISRKINNVKLNEKQKLIKTHILMKNQKRWLSFLGFLIFGKWSSTSCLWYDSLINSRLFLRKTRLIFLVVLITSLIRVSSLFNYTLAVPILRYFFRLKTGLI